LSHAVFPVTYGRKVTEAVIPQRICGSVWARRMVTV
jgi:hypothetical protein